MTQPNSEAEACPILDSSLNPTESSSETSSDAASDTTPVEVNFDTNTVDDERPNIEADERPNQVADESPNQVADESPNQVAEESPNQVAVESPNAEANQSLQPAESLEESQNENCNSDKIDEGSRIDATSVEVPSLDARIEADSMLKEDVSSSASALPETTNETVGYHNDASPETHVSHSATNTPSTFKMAIHDTGPPVRLRMSSADRLCARSMVVEWEDGSETRQKWFSQEDPLQNGWYEAEKLLPPSATNITVHFKLRVPRKQIDVLAVDRQNNCSWVLLGDKRYVPEIITFRIGTRPSYDPVDAVFELKGPLHRCFLHRAWNAARHSALEEWESWEDEESRPPSEGDPETLIAANEAAIPKDYSDLEAYLKDATDRLSAAALKMLGVHRETLRALKGLDASCTGQWLRANLGTSAGAGFMVAAVPLFFVLPPVGIGLAIAGSVAGSAALGGDALQERWSLTRLKNQLSRDNWNAFVTMELLREWVRASELAGQNSLVANATEENKRSSRPSSGMSTAKSMAYAVAMFGDEAAAFLPILGPIGVAFGAVLTTGIAIHGWGTSKFSQKELRGQMSQLKSRLLFYQYLLSRLGHLDCPICGKNMSETDCLRCCLDQIHYCHDECFQELDGGSNCPTCAALLDEHTRTIIGDCKAIVSNATQVSSEDQEDGVEADESPMGPSLPQLEGTVLDDEEILELASRVDHVTSIMSSPPENDKQAALAGAELHECEFSSSILQAFIDDAASRPDGTELALRAADTLEQLQSLRGSYETWAKTRCASPPENQDGDSPSSEFADSLVSEPAAAESAVPAAFDFTPPTRMTDVPDGGRSGLAFSKFRMMGQKVSGMKDIASQKATAFSHSASSAASAVASEVSGATATAAQKASQVASEIKGKSVNVKDKAAGMASSLLKEKAPR